MSDEQAAMMLRLQQLGLALDDLRIYLDTHLNDSAAIERYNATAEEYHALHQEYSKKFTPLRQDDPSNRANEWAWGMSDFPWDF